MIEEYSSENHRARKPQRDADKSNRNVQGLVPWLRILPLFWNEQFLRSKTVSNLYNEEFFTH